MTDNLLLKLEERMMTLLAELENLRKELNQSKQENMLLKTDKFNHTQKLQEMITLLDSLEPAGFPLSSIKAESMQANEEFAHA